MTTKMQEAAAAGSSSTSNGPSRLDEQKLIRSSMPTPPSLQQATLTSGSRTVSVESIGSSTASSSSNSDSEDCQSIKKRPLSEITGLPSPLDTRGNKRQKQLKRVRFHVEPEANATAQASTNTGDTLQQKLKVQIHSYERDYQPEDIWFTQEELLSHVQRHQSLLQFYHDNCEDVVDSILLVWVNCAEVALDDGIQCMTPDKRRDVAHKIATSPVRGFERSLASAFVAEQRQKTLQGILELQTLCNLSQTVGQARSDVLAEASQAFSQTAALFARTLAMADAQVAESYHGDSNNYNV